MMNCSVRALCIGYIMVPSAVWQMMHERRGRENHTARGEAECCMSFQDHTTSAVFAIQHIGTMQ